MTILRIFFEILNDWFLSLSRFVDKPSKVHWRTLQGLLTNPPRFIDESSKVHRRTLQGSLTNPPRFIWEPFKGCFSTMEIGIFSHGRFRNAVRAFPEFPLSGNWKNILWNFAWQPLQHSSTCLQTIFISWLKSNHPTTCNYNMQLFVYSITSLQLILSMHLKSFFGHWA